MEAMKTSMETEKKVSCYLYQFYFCCASLFLRSTIQRISRSVACAATTVVAGEDTVIGFSKLKLKARRARYCG